MHEIVGRGVKTLHTVVKRLGNSATVSARVIGGSDVAKGAAAATAEAARFALDRTYEAFEKANLHKTLVKPTFFDDTWPRDGTTDGPR